MDSGLTASDVALLNNNEWGGNSFMWIFALLILANGGFGGWGRNGDFGQYASAASQQEILFGQQFQGLDNKIDRLGNGIADATFALNNSIKDGNAMVAGRVVDEGRALQAQIADCRCTTQRNIDSVRFDMANYANQTNANTTEQIQKVLDAISTNRMADMQNQINQLQLSNAMCGVVRYPSASTYYAGTNPFCGCGSGCGTSLI